MFVLLISRLFFFVQCQVVPGKAIGSHCWFLSGVVTWSMDWKKARGSWCDCPDERFDCLSWDRVMWRREKMGAIWRNKQLAYLGKDHKRKCLQGLGRSFKQGVSMASWGLWHTVWQGQPLLRASWLLPCRKWGPAGIHLFSFSREISNSDFFFNAKSPTF